MKSWHSYPSIFNLGHRAIERLLKVPVNVEEKVDGSQFSFGVNHDGEIKVRSKGAQLNVIAPEKMFTAAIDTVQELASVLTPEWTYRAEYLAKPKHNSLTYDRFPTKHLIIFDVCTGEEAYLSYEDKAIEAKRIGLEVVPLLFSGMLEEPSRLREILDTVSVLGGQKIEGVVIKPAAYELFGEDKKVLLGKFVSEAFKEIHAGEWKKSNPSTGDILEALKIDYRTQARWQKALIHLKERGLIENSPKDIGALIKEVSEDIDADSKDAIKDKLFTWAWPHIRRAASHGLPEWYKDELLKSQFETEAA